MASQMTDDQLVEKITKMIGTSPLLSEYTITLPDCSQEKIDSMVEAFNRSEGKLSAVKMIDKKGFLIKVKKP